MAEIFWSHLGVVVDSFVIADVVVVAVVVAVIRAISCVYKNPHAKQCEVFNSTPTNSKCFTRYKYNVDEDAHLGDQFRTQQHLRMPSEIA